LHRNAGIELIYVKRGSVEWVVDDAAWTIPPASIFFTLPWQRHGGANEVEKGVELYFSIIPTIPGKLREPSPLEVPRALGMSEEETREVVDALAQASRPFVPARAPLPVLLRRLHELNHADPAEPRLLAAYCRVTLLETAAALREGLCHPGADFARQVTRQALEELARRCDEPWTLEGMAALAGFGRTRFSALVGELTGDTPIRHLNRLRVRRACELLREGASRSRSITEIAHRCGFSDSAYFNRVFKSFTAKTPRAYRKSG
jgi:AraC-like DNA-binding protein